MLAATPCRNRKPQRGEQYELGARWFWASGGLSLAFFELTKFDVAVPTGIPLVSVLDGEQRSRGLELEASGKIGSNFDLYLSYAYTDTEVVDSGFGAANDGLPFAGIPENKLVAWAFWAFSNRWSLGYGLDYQDSSPGDPAGSFSTPGRTLQHLRLQSDWQFRDTQIDIDLQVRNLTDKRWWQNNFNAFFVKNGEPRGVYVTVGVDL